MPALVLMYHDLVQDPLAVAPGHRPYVLSPEAFRRQMQAIVSANLATLTVTQWTESPRFERSMVITFDDGHVSNHELALPILLEHGLKATFFVTAGAVGKSGTMGWEQIRSLHNAGMEIGSHTLTHRPPATLSDDELRYELRESRRILENGLGAPVTSISSPTGFFNPRMRAIARETGYRSLSFGQIGLACESGDPFSLNRVVVKCTTSQSEFEALLRFDQRTIGRLRQKQRVRSFARKALGVRTYLRVRRLLIAAKPTT